MTTGLTYEDLAPAFPEIFLAVSAMALLVLGVFRGDRGSRLLFLLSLLVLVGTGVCLSVVPFEKTFALNGLFLSDPFAIFLKVLILTGSALSLCLSMHALRQDRATRFEFPVLLLLATLGMMMMVSAGDFLSLYLGLELQSLALYVLASIRTDSLRSSEAGLKYFVLGALSSGMILFGTSLVYGYAGTTSFEAIAESLSHGGESHMILTAGLVFLLSGLAFKISAVPFHMWTPDVYEGAPTPVTALFAIVPKIAALGVLMRLLFGPFWELAPEWTQVLVCLSAASMVLGAFAAIVQNNVKRLLAYSSIGNMGYALIGVVSGDPSAVLVYLSIYMVMTAGAFGVVLYMRRDGLAVETITDLAGLSRTNPFLAYAMTIFMFSMSGIPPMAGFFGKLVIFSAAVNAGFYSLAVLGVLASVVAAWYYLRIVKVMFFDESVGPFDPDFSIARHAVVLACAAFILALTLMPAPLIESVSVIGKTVLPTHS